MNLMAHQQKVKDSTKRINIFGFSAASGKSQMLVEILKSELKVGKKVVFMLNNYNHIAYKGIYQSIVDQVQEEIKGVFSLNTLTFKADNGGGFTFQNEVSKAYPPDTVLIESLHAFDKNPLNIIPEQTKVYCSTHSAKSHNHWLSILLRDFYTTNGYLNLPAIDRSTDEEIKLTVFPYGVNSYISKDYYDVMSKLGEEEFKRLTLGFCKP